MLLKAISSSFSKSSSLNSRSSNLYCMFKYLSRGSSHPVYNLKSPNPATNPYLQWVGLKTKAANSVKIEINHSRDGWNNFFYNSTFLPRG